MGKAPKRQLVRFDLCFCLSVLMVFIVKIVIVIINSIQCFFSVTVT